MNTLVRSSKWPSYDSLRSTSSLILSETEDEAEADVFSEGEGDADTLKIHSVDEGIVLSPGNYLHFPARANQPNMGYKMEPHCAAGEPKHPGPASSPGAATLATSSATPGDLAFAQKCADLQRFIQPLLDLLQRLKMGRFDKGLSSFQQSVAIDRLQRILGVLQRPEMGEKYLQNLLKIEMMLKIWFPRVPLRPVEPPIHAIAPRLQSHWCKNQLHMPVKKRKMSWTDPEYAGPIPTKHRHHHQYWSCRAAPYPGTVPTLPPASPETRHHTPAAEGASRHVFTDGGTRGASGRQPYLCGSRDNGSRSQPEGFSLRSTTLWGSPAAQDSSVSSSNTISSRTNISAPV